MRKTVLLACILFLLPTCATAQVSDSIVERMVHASTIDCGAEQSAAFSLIPTLYQQGNVQQIDSIISYLNHKCGVGAPLFHVVALLAMKDGAPGDNFSLPGSSPAADSARYTDSIISYLLDYRAAVKPWAYNYGSVEANYYAFLNNLAKNIVVPKQNKVAQYLVDFYRYPEKIFLGTLVAKAYNGTRLQTAWLKDRHAPFTEQEDVYTDEGDGHVVTLSPNAATGADGQKNNTAVAPVTCCTGGATPHYDTLYHGIGNNDVERMMTRRVYSCDRAIPGAAAVIPKLYLDREYDSINDVIGYVERNCGVEEPFFSYRVLQSISDGSFNERVFKLGKDSTTSFNYYRLNIVSYLHWYRLGANIAFNPYAYSPDNTSASVIKPLNNYYGLLKSMADTIRTKPALTPVARLLADFYANPAKYARKIPRYFDSGYYKGTQLRASYLENTLNRYTLSGFHIAATAGTWTPQGGLATIGTHPFAGFTMGGRIGHLMFDFNYSERFGNAAHSFQVSYHDTVFSSYSMEGHFAGLDMGVQLFKLNRHEADLLLGVAIDAMDLKFDTNRVTNTYSSLDANIGLGYKYFTRYIGKERYERWQYVAIQVKYHYLDYNNPGGSSFLGNSVTVGVLCGLYKHKIRWYYSLP